jgi:hypothetical protein
MGRPKTGSPPRWASLKNREAFREAILYMKGSPEYFDFVNRVCEKTGITKAQMFRVAFAEWCERQGHGTPPEI